jgi:hypothetical protein
MDEVADLKLPVPSFDVDRKIRAAALYTASGRDAALRAMRATRAVDFSPVMVCLYMYGADSQFDDKETSTFEAELERAGGLDSHDTAKLLGKRPEEVLRFSYIWKNKKLKLENEAIRQHHKVSTAHARQNKTLGAPSLGRIRAGADSSASDDEVSLHSSAPNKTQCAACSTRISGVWWRCPRTVQGSSMCETCG